MTDAILVVDDSLTVRMDLAEAFEAAGFRPLACATAAQARETLARETIALVVLDVRLPDADGITLLQEIRSSPSTASVPILLLSSEADVKDRIRGLKTGADDYVGKPYDVQYVVARARELLRLRNGSPSAEPTTILIIDDSLTFRHRLQEALEANGYSVLTASNGEEGLRLAASRRPAAIVVDGVMPGMDGGTVIRRTRLDAALRTTVCILLTASEDRGAEIQALEAGADAFVRKEEDLDVILARLAAVLRSAREQPTRAPSLLGPIRVLAIDDSLTYLNEVAAVLRDEGYDVILATSGPEALEMLAIQGVDCILLDLLMPGMNGNETCLQIKASPILRDIPLVMLTALEGREAMIESLGSGADDFIAKSSDFEVLKARVRAQLRRKQFEDEHRRIREELLHSELEAREARAARAIAEAKAKLVEELARKNEELESFSYSVSHDLRAPLRHITGFAELLIKHSSGTLDEKGRRFLDTISESAKRMGQLIDDLLVFSRMGMTEMEIGFVNLGAIVESVRHELESTGCTNGVDWSCSDLPTLRGDSPMLRMVLMNLLSNAVKYSSKQSKPAIRIGSYPLGKEVVVFVKDNGVGFDMQYAHKLFGVFQRLHRSEEFEGTGIGLANVRRIVHRHGGRTWAESEPGSGATFFFSLPGSIPEEAAS